MNIRPPLELAKCYIRTNLELKEKISRLDKENFIKKFRNIMVYFRCEEYRLLIKEMIIDDNQIIFFTSTPQIFTIS